MFRRIFLAAMMLMQCAPSSGAVFVPAQPAVPVMELRPGMRGHMLTVLRGTEPSSIPVRIVSIVPQKPGRTYSSLILVKIMGGTKLAQGMSGSPVYIGGKLAGAVRSGWEDSDQTLAAVIPIDAMCTLHELEIPKADFAAMSDVAVSGLSINTPAMHELSRKLGVKFTQGISGASGSGGIVAGTPSLKPGDSVAALLVWGDIELSALGTVTATDRHGRFLAFGHDFMKRGNSAYPSAGAYVHDIVDSVKFPFKLASTLGINGTITQDREQGIAGIFGRYPLSVTGEFVFRDMDRGTEDKYRFRTVTDEFLASELITGVCSALAEESWNRKGQGTMLVNLRIDGREIPNGWTRKDIFFSEENIAEEAFKQAKTIISAYLTQPFSSVMPSGFSITVQATQNPRILMIEDIEAPENASPGDEVEISVKLRGWRTDLTTRKFTMKIPEDISGVVELIVRGGGTQPFPQTALEEGLKSVTSLSRMLEEFKAADANNQLILELNADRTGEFLKKIKDSKKSGGRQTKKKEREPDFLPEEEEYLSETKERRIKEGTLRIYSSDYYIDGLMRRIIHTEK